MRDQSDQKNCYRTLTELWIAYVRNGHPYNYCLSWNGNIEWFGGSHLRKMIGNAYNPHVGGIDAKEKKF